MIKLEKGDNITKRLINGILLTIPYDPIYDGDNIYYSKDKPDIKIERDGKVLIDNLPKVNKT